MESAAQAVLAYVNSQIGKSEYNGMALREAFSAIIEDADEDTRKGWMSSVTLKEGYTYSVSCTSTEETYRTDLFNQGKTALVATTLVMDESQSEICGWKWTQKPEKWPNDIGVCVIEGTINGQQNSSQLFCHFHCNSSNFSGFPVFPYFTPPAGFVNKRNRFDARKRKKAGHSRVRLLVQLILQIPNHWAISNPAPPQALPRGGGSG